MVGTYLRQINYRLPLSIVMPPAQFIGGAKNQGKLCLDKKIPKEKII